MTFKPKVLAFACENSALLAIELAKELNIPLDQKVTVINLPCSGKADEIYILKAFEHGVDGVMVLACHKEGCKFKKGNLEAIKRVFRAQKALGEIGIEEERVVLCHVSANGGVKLAEEIDRMLEKVKALGSTLGR